MSEPETNRKTGWKLSRWFPEIVQHQHLADELRPCPVCRAQPYVLTRTSPSQCGIECAVTCAIHDDIMRWHPTLFDAVNVWELVAKMVERTSPNPEWETAQPIGYPIQGYALEQGFNPPSTDNHASIYYQLGADKTTVWHRVNGQWQLSTSN